LAAGIPIGLSVSTNSIHLMLEPKEPMENILIHTPEEIQNILQQIDKLDLGKDTDFSTNQQELVHTLLRKNAHIFAPNLKAPKITPKVKHTIYTGDHLQYNSADTDLAQQIMS
jgi:hypothetical protein